MLFTKKTSPAAVMLEKSSALAGFMTKFADDTTAVGGHEKRGVAGCDVDRACVGVGPGHFQITSAGRVYGETRCAEIGPASNLRGAALEDQGTVIGESAATAAVIQSARLMARTGECVPPLIVVLPV